MTNHRWAVQLQGEAFDIEDARSVFHEPGDVRAFEATAVNGEKVPALTASSLQAFDAASEVNESAAPLLDQINGVLWLRDPTRRPITKAGVLESRPGGTWGRHIYLEINEAIRLRTRLSATVLSVSSAQPAPPPPPPVEWAWMAAASSSDRVADVLTFLRGEPDWFGLWKAFEIVEQTCEGRGGMWQRGWAVRSDVNNFAMNAQYHRHAGDKRPRDFTPLTLDDGRRFVQKLVVAWLNDAGTTK